MLNLMIGAITINWINLVAYGPILFFGLAIYLGIFWALPWYTTFSDEDRLGNVWRMHIFPTIIVLIIWGTIFYCNWSANILTDPNNNGKIIEKVIER